MGSMAGGQGGLLQGNMVMLGLHPIFVPSQEMPVVRLENSTLLSDTGAVQCLLRL